MAKLQIHNTQIKHDTGRMSLVSVPKSNNSVWLPDKLIYADNNGYSSTIYVPDDFTFSAVRGKTIKFEMSGIDVQQAFTSVNVLEKSKEVFRHNEPKPMEPVKERVIDADLAR